MSAFFTYIENRLEDLRSKDLFRQIRTLDSLPAPTVSDGKRELINFSSNDYLGLANSDDLKEAAKAAIDEYGAGAGSARLICGTQRIHTDLEEALAEFKGTEAALAFNTGYATAAGCITALLSRKDVLIIDKLVHACIVDAARQAGCHLRVYRHNDLNDLEKKLQWANKKHPDARTLIATESVFSMDGDIAPLLNIVELKENYGAWLMVDEAHGTGLFGEHRRGVIEEYKLSDRVEIQMATLGKAIGASGGAICGSRSLIDLLINHARSFIYSTAPTPASVAAAKKGVEILQGTEGEKRRQRLWAMVDNLKNTFIDSGQSPGIVRSPIVPLICGSSESALSRSEQLYDSGILVPAIRYPTVARNQARLRFTITADHTLDHLAQLEAALSTPEDDE